MVGTRLGRPQQADGRRGELLLALAHPRRIGHGPQHAGGQHVQALQHRHRGLAAHPGRQQPDERGQRELGLTDHVDRRAPAHGAGQRVGELADPVGERGQRPRVEPDQRVAEVVVVEQHEVGLRLANQVRHGRARPVDVDLDPPGAGERAAGPVIQPDRDVMRPQRRVLGRRLLEHGERRERAVRADLELGSQRVRASGLQPRARPVGQRLARARGQRAQQVGEGRVGPAVVGQVVLDPVEEARPADVRDQLLEHRSALGVADPVEVRDRLGQRRHVRGDRVRGRHLVLHVADRLAEVGEGRPRVAEPGRLGRGEERAELGERLVQPQVVPPLHRHQVAEPHVRHLVQDHHGPGLVHQVGDLRAEQELLGDRHAGHVLHRAAGELRHEHLVVLGERVAGAEQPLVEVEALLGDREHVAGVEVAGERGPAGQPERDHLAARGGVHVGDQAVVTGRHGGEVGGDARRGREMPHRFFRPALPTPARGLGLRRRLVRQHVPVRGRGDVEREHGLEVGLLEVREHLARLGGLEIRVRVHALIGRVDRPLHARPVALVRAVRDDPKLVVRGQPGQGDPPLGVSPGRADRHAVQHDLVHVLGDQVDVARRARLGAAEPDHGHRAEHLAPAGQVQRDVIAVYLQKPASLSGFGPGDLCNRHGTILTSGRYATPPG